MQDLQTETRTTDSQLASVMAKAFDPQSFDPGLGRILAVMKHVSIASMGF